MLRTITIATLMIVGLQTFASEPRKHRATGTEALATTEGLPKEIIERVKRIESKKRPKPRTWSGEEAAALMARPESTKARQMAVERGARFHRRLADGLVLKKKEKAKFLSVLADGHEARLVAVAYTLKQGSGFHRRIPALARAGELPEVFKKADPTIINRKLRKLLGEERFEAYLKLRDKESSSSKVGGVK